VRSPRGARPLGALLGLLLLLVTAPVRAQAVALVSSSFNTGSLQASWSHTVPPGGQNRYLLVGVSLRHVQRATVVSEARFVDAANVTQPLALLGSATSPGQVRIELWGLAAPSEGQGVITVRLDATGGLVAGGLSFTGVHQVASIGAVVSNMGTGATASVAVPSATGEAIVSVFGNNGIVLPVPRAPHTSQWAFQGQLFGAGGHEAGRTGATVVWDTPGASLPWLLAGVSVKPAQPVALPPDAGPPDLAPISHRMPSCCRRMRRRRSTRLRWGSTLPAAFPGLEPGRSRCPDHLLTCRRALPTVPLAAAMGPRSRWTARRWRTLVQTAPRPPTRARTADRTAPSRSTRARTTLAAPAGLSGRSPGRAAALRWRPWRRSRCWR
jgi:hypothetical protein